MAENRFFRSVGPIALADIADALGGDLWPSETRGMSLNDIAPLETAGPTQVSVYTDDRYSDALEKTKAGVVITSQTLLARIPAGMTAIVVKEPRLAFAQAGYLFYPQAASVSRVSPSAVVDATATLGDGAQIDHGVVIEAGAEIGAGCIIGHNSVIGRGVKLGTFVKVGTNCSISHAVIGEGTEIASNVTIGSEGFGFVPSSTGLLRMLQIGAVTIGSDVKIGANCSIDRGTSGDTEIGDGTVLDNLVHIGHNVRIGKLCVICGQVGIAGSTTVGNGVMIGGQAGISDHLVIGAGAKIAAKSGVIRDVPAKAAVGGYPAVPIRIWHRQTAAFARMFAAKSTDVLRRWPLTLPSLLLIS